MTINYAVIGEESVHRTQRMILEALGEFDHKTGRLVKASPSKLAVQLNVPLGNVSYHMSALVENGWAVEVETKAVRGALEHFYSLSQRVWL